MHSWPLSETARPERALLCIHANSRLGVTVALRQRVERTDGGRESKDETLCPEIENTLGSSAEVNQVGDAFNTLFVRKMFSGGQPGSAGDGKGQRPDPKAEGPVFV